MAVAGKHSPLGLPCTGDFACSATIGDVGDGTGDTAYALTRPFTGTFTDGTHILGVRGQAAYTTLFVMNSMPLPYPSRHFRW